jgi:NADH-quinone oxidoreductase subunit A
VNSEHVAAVAAAAVPVSALWPLLAYAAILVVLLAAVLMITHLSGERHNAAAADEPFESGIVGVGDARLRRAARFYLIAMFFVIFDVEALFVFPWAISAESLGWFGIVEIFVFIAVLLVGLAYLWRKGLLTWA